MVMSIGLKNFSGFVAWRQLHFVIKEYGATKKPLATCVIMQQMSWRVLPCIDELFHADMLNLLLQVAGVVICSDLTFVIKAE
ncbi:hypothetical protein M8C21_017362 [Ambrosia artemisiifolia]|uniref:Uncharacterized protein n=1 Tax=Ambrosia artemisiifolia TaxID=4212 RepID=A0AAD5DBH8_AMBAR|nr:hypothetical protein M8C21_017362 [Ambrosia artemisiifolia]